MIDATRLKPLIEQVRTYQHEQLHRHKINFGANWALVICALGSAAMTTVGGILKWDHTYIALSGVVGSVAVGLQTAFGIGDKAEFQRVVASRCANIMLFLTDSSLTDDDFVKLRERFTALREHAEITLPTGGGVESASKLPPQFKATQLNFSDSSGPLPASESQKSIL